MKNNEQTFKSGHNTFFIKFIDQNLNTESKNIFSFFLGFLGVKYIIRSYIFGKVKCLGGASTEKPYRKLPFPPDRM